MYTFFNANVGIYQWITFIIFICSYIVKLGLKTQREHPLQSWEDLHNVDKSFTKKGRWEADYTLQDSSRTKENPNDNFSPGSLYFFHDAHDLL